MAGIMQIPPMNEIRFVPEGLTLLNIYNYFQFDQDWAYNQLYPFQQKVLYKYRKQDDDTICIQLHTNLTGVELEIRESITNVILDTIAPTSNAFFPGNEVEGIPLETLQWLFKISDEITFTGTCYCVIKGITPTFLTTTYYVSEPIWVKPKWKETVLINYSHNKNDHDIFFSMGPEFSHRIDGYLPYENTESLDTQFEDQYNTTKTLNSFLVRKFRLELGLYKGIPRYYIDKLAYVFSCKTIRIEGFFYTKDQGAQLEFEKSDTAALFNVSIMLQEANPSDSYTFITERSIPLVKDGDYPYAILNLALISGTNQYFLVQDSVNPVVIDNNGDLTTEVGNWNAAAAGLGLLGSFAIQDGYAVYNADNQERFDPLVDLRTIVTGMQLILNGSNSFINAKFINANDFLIDWGSSLNVIPASGSLQNILHTFANGGTSGASVRIFHENEISNITLNALTDTANLVSLSGDVSSNLNTLNIQILDATATSFDLTPIISARQNLQNLTIVNSSVATLTLPFNNGFDYSTNFYKLAVINLGDNKLTVGSVSGFIIDLDQYANINRNPGIVKGLTIDNQTPPATPNFAAQFVKSTLIGQGWVVITD